jgi:Cys-tRNA(Pro)/Cys-tRNA(Cys) deacylase
VYKAYEAAVALLIAHNLPFTIHEHPPSYTVADAKAQLPFPVERLLKTIAFKLKTGGCILAALRGPDRVDYRNLAAAVEAKRADIVQLSLEEVIDLFGVEVGTVSPISGLGSAQVIFDTQVSTTETLFCGIGRADRTLEIHLLDLVRLTQGRILPLVSD